ncbi:MAG: glycosyltransferase [Sinobacteraceae bacterium]|nr:glycosyltransferase [Pseudomonadales bacterium]MCP5327349.1 glycosyltransferase [Nevskiaceae bacterium]MCP5470729.1 glycosyltransferase [Nevskiaceae bacterium]
MRILHVIDTLDYGGAEKVVVSLANGAAAKHHVDVCTLGRLGALADELDAHIRTFSLNRRPGNSPASLLHLVRLIRDGRYDVVHGHNWSALLETATAAAITSTPCRIHTMHGPYPASPSTISGRAKRILRRWLEQRASRRLGRIVCVSEAIAAYIPSTIGIDRERLQTIHNGIDTAPEVERPSSRRLSFITVGRLDTIKNQALMLRAFSSLGRHFETARLIFVGDGPERENLRHLAIELGIDSRVDFLGFRNDIDDLLAKADIFLLSSHYEGISMALLEAMRSGLPCVATRVGGVPETVIDGETGLLTEPNDLRGFTNSMRELAESEPRRRTMGTAARAFQLREFSRFAMLQQYEALYLEECRQGISA